MSRALGPQPLEKGERLVRHGVAQARPAHVGPRTSSSQVRGLRLGHNAAWAIKRIAEFLSHAYTATARGSPRDATRGGAVWYRGGPTPRNSPAFEVTSKRRKGFPSETHVKRGFRIVGGRKELIREARPRGPLPVRQREALSRTAA